ncbi:hypothetical protein [Streptomyces showdoensis]|uniref:hypothetical protein n=1 Tax=Streptomyces showdoensis TaxID=68268 RepID=UPI000F4F1787|nr:hypothetical protein [Streptomyces showdoensis]
MAVLLSAAISVGPAALTPLTGLLPQAVAASLTLAPNTGPPGTSVQVHGDGFSSCSPVTITFDGGHGVPGTANLPQISGTIAVPADATPGGHKIAANCKPLVDSGGDYYYAAATFTVTGAGPGPGDTTNPAESLKTATISLDKSEGPPKTQFTVSGSGFGKCYADDVELYAGEKKLVDHRIDVSADEGSFSQQAEVFEGTPPGTYQITAVCVGYPNIKASAPFTVTEKTAAHPALALDPKEGEKGKPAQADGTGFTCPDVELDWDDGGVLTPATVTDGTFSTGITIPADAQPGAHTVRAACTADAEQYADAPFTVKAGPTENGGNQNGGTDQNGGNENGGDHNGGNQNGGTDNGGDQNGGGTDNGGTDNGGTDNGGTDNGGDQNGGGTDNGGNQNTGGTDNGGNQNTGGTTGGDSGGSATPVGWIVGPASLGGVLAVAVAAGAYFGRLHRGPRWVRGHVKARLRPVTGSADLTEARAPGEPPTHSTRLDPHPDPGRQTLDEEDR